MKTGLIAVIASIVVAFVLVACGSGTKAVVNPPRPDPPQPSVLPKFLYAGSCVGSSNGRIDGYSVNPTTGALTTLSGSPFAKGIDCPNFMATTPDQHFLFVPDDEDELIHVYAIGSTGTLTEASGSPYSQCAFQVAVDPSGQFLIAPDFCNGNVVVYSI